jgi:hypothetical protein
MPWLRQLVAGLSPRRRHGFALRSVHVGFVVDRVAGFSLSSLVFLCQYHSTMALCSYITCRMNNRLVGACSSETLCHPINMNMNANILTTMFTSSLSGLCLQVKQECDLAVKCLNNPNINSFQALFMTSMPFYHQFDHIVRYVLYFEVIIL